MSLYAELKRRNVIRAALLYVVSSWLILQVTDVGISLLELPAWTGRMVIFLLAIGFLVVVVFSWVYEITPEGVKRDRDAAPGTSSVGATARKLDIAVIALLLIALAAMVTDRFILNDDPVIGDEAPLAADLTDHSIAVLPFVNISGDQDNEYFSDGLSEELLNLLARVPKLQVVARTSAFSFKNSGADIQEIAERLGVAHVLEGSVRKSGDNIRITAQLIRASNGYQLWSESWDRELNDVFAIQDEIAAAVVEELRLTLFGDAPRAQVADTNAYELYLQSIAVSNLMTREALDEAASLLEEAVAIDPEFSAAWAELGEVKIYQVGRVYVQGDDRVDEAVASYLRALEIDSQNAGALSGLGWIAMIYEWDFARATSLVNRALAIEPRNIRVLNAAAALAGVFGDDQKQILILEEALKLDPLALTVLHNLYIRYTNSDRLEEALWVLNTMKSAHPNSLLVAIDDAWGAWFNEDSELALEKFGAIGGSAGYWGRVFALHDLGRHEQVERELLLLKDAGARPFQLATSYAYMGDDDRAFAEFDHAFETRDGWLLQARQLRFLDRLYADPRWESLLLKMGISDADIERMETKLTIPASLLED